MKTGKYLLALLLILALATGTWLAYARHLEEDNNRRVELAVDARLLNGSDFNPGGHSAPEQLLELQKAGCTAVAVTPLSLNELEKMGELVSLSPTLYLIKGEEGLGRQLQAALVPLLPDVELKKIEIGFGPWAGDGEAKEYQALSLPGRYAPAIKGLPLILPGQQMLAWQRAGLQSVPLFNYPARLSPRLSEKYWGVLAQQLQEIRRTMGVQFGPVVFPAASFHYPAPQGAAGTILREEGLALGVAEFTQGRGLQELTAALDYRLHRTHRIPAATLAQLGESGALERYLRAVQERKVRLLLLQPFPGLDPRNEWAAYLPLIQNLSKNLQKAGFQPGLASSFPIYRLPAAAAALLGAGIAAATVLLAGFFWKRRGKVTDKKIIPWGGALLILATAGVFLAGERLPFYILGKQLAALAAALVFPLLSTVLFLWPPLKPLDTAIAEKNENVGVNGVHFKNLAGGFLLATLLTLGGAIIAAGLLSSTPFLLKIESFRGVKIAQVGPFLLLVLWFLLPSGQGLWHTGRNFLETRLKVKHLVLLALAGGIILVYLLRGGNTSILPASSLELALRHRLEVLFVARPRFKEFLIGHPGFFLFAALAARRLPGARVLALLLGLLGQISLFNTFMHLHRPVGLSLLGTVYGAGLGLLGGLALYYLCSRKQAGTNN